MPVYEYACNGCGARVSIFTRSIGSPITEVCDRCGGTDLRRLISKVAFLRPPADPNAINKQALFDGVDYNDPRSIAQWTRKLQDQLGEPMSEEMDDTLQRFERGEGSVNDFIPQHSDHSAFDGGVEGSDD